MSNTKEILRHMAELYSKPTATKTLEQAVQLSLEKLIAHFDEYDKAFSEFLTYDILKAIDSFWRYKSDKTRPTLAEIMALVRSDKNTQKVETDFTGKKVDYKGYFSIENKLMQRDVELKCCVNILPTYRKAVDRILNYDLAAKVGIDEVKRAIKFARSDCETRGIKYALAMKNGLFNDFEEKLVEVGGNRPSTTSKPFVVPFNALAAHMRTDEATSSRSRNDNRYEQQASNGSFEF